MTHSSISLSIMEEPKLVWDDTENAENHQNGEKARYSIQLFKKIRCDFFRTSNRFKNIFFFSIFLFFSEGGPCKCGFRHWVNGEIYDFVFGLQGEAIGFNLGTMHSRHQNKFVKINN